MSLCEKRYQLWITNAFDRPFEIDQSWYFDCEQEEIISLDPHEAIDFYQQLFTYAKKDLAPFSVGQIANGLSYLLFNNAGNDMYLVINEGFDDLKMRDLIRAIPTLYQDIFYRLCRSNTEQDQQSIAENCRIQRERLEHVCIMWWDEDIWIYFLQQRYPDQFTEDFAQMFESVLVLPHHTTQYSALHGLGHFHLESKQAAKRVESIVGAALQKNQIIASLIDYAASAKIGSVQ